MKTNNLIEDSILHLTEIIENKSIQEIKSCKCKHINIIKLSLTEKENNNLYFKLDVTYSLFGSNYYTIIYGYLDNKADVCIESVSDYLLSSTNP